MLSKNLGEIDVVSIPINMLTIVRIKYEKYFCRVGLRNLSFRFGGVGNVNQKILVIQVRNIINYKNKLIRENKDNIY